MDQLLPARSDRCTDTAESSEVMPDTLGGVHLERLIGEGGMGRVYLGHHPILDVDVAIKVMSNRGGDRGRFLTEARLAARVQHDNIVRILHAGDENGWRFLVLEYVPGSNLKQLVEERGPLPWREAVGHLLQAARGLAVAHRQGIVHRDIKPSNLLLSPDGRIKVADLGVARALFGSGSSSGSDDSSYGGVVGTPAYMAPEQAFDPRLVTPASDVYGLGSSLYYLLSGQLPFAKGTFCDLLAMHREKSVPDVGLVCSGLPDPVRALCTRLLAKDPDERPADGAAAVIEFERVLGLATGSTSIRKVRTPERRTQRLWWTAAAAGLAGVGTLLLGWGHDDHRAGAALVAAEPPAPAIAAVAPRTPPRAVFVLAGSLPVAAQAGLAEACQASGLPVVERARIDTLVAEQRMVADGRIDPADAARVGRLVGGHIAIFAEPVEDQVEVRCVLVETGELIACRLVPPAEVAIAAAAGIAAASAQLPVQAAIERQAGAVIVHAGQRHGLRIGDRLGVRRDPAGADVAVATITAVEASRATVVVEPAAADLHGALAMRLTR